MVVGENDAAHVRRPFGKSSTSQRIAFVGRQRDRAAQVGHAPVDRPGSRRPVFQRNMLAVVPNPQGQYIVFGNGIDLDQAWIGDAGRRWRSPR